jgi:hypothetical protein
MFQFPQFAPFRVTVIAHRRVAPFGHPGIAGCVLLPPAYRSLPRPSSPSCAQASPTCFRSLDHKIVSKQSTRDLLDRVFNVIQHLALDSFPTITTYELLSNNSLLSHVSSSAQDDALISLLRERRQEMQEEKEIEIGMWEASTT